MPFEWLANNLWVILGGLLLYMKKTTDRRLDVVEVNVSEQHTRIEVQKEKLDSLEKVIDTKLDSLARSMDEIKAIVEGLRR